MGRIFYNPQNKKGLWKIVACLCRRYQQLFAVTASVPVHMLVMCILVNITSFAVQI